MNNCKNSNSTQSKKNNRKSIGLKDVQAGQCL